MATKNPTEEFSYDRVAYPSFVFPQTSPHRLAAKGTLYGMSPPDPRTCRYLDLGCGDGSNLLLHAFDFPKSEFVGIDLSKIRIAEARSYAAALELTNVSFHHADIMQFGQEDFGEFDYIVAHGLYSWVPDSVREKTRSIYGDCLTANGIGYVSYNTYPGCHVREMLWRMMQFHTASVDEPKAKIEKAVHFLATLRDTTPDQEFRDILKAEIVQIIERRSGSVFHDDLSTLNKPFYFHEFVSDMNSKGLQYLCDIEPLAGSTINMPPTVKGMIESMSADPMVREQYLDFAMWTRFRSSLVCRQAVPIDRNPQPQILDQFRLYSDVEPVSEHPNVLDGVDEAFSLAYGGTFHVSIGSVKKALIRLSSANPRSVPLRELIESITDESSGDDVDDLRAILMSLVLTGILKLQLFQPSFADSAGEYPFASPFARWQASRGAESLTSLAGFTLSQENPALIELVNILDGTKNRAELCREMSTRYEVPEEDRAAFKEELPLMIDNHLDTLAKMAFLQH
jgi:SAM-dependent methyltransferase/methyltransferase-like protein